MKQLSFRSKHHISLGHGAITSARSTKHLKEYEKKVIAVEEQHKRNVFAKFFRSLLSSLKVYGFYLITLETVLTGLVSVGMTIYWYQKYVSTLSKHAMVYFLHIAFILTHLTSVHMLSLQNDPQRKSLPGTWSGGGMDWIILGFVSRNTSDALISPSLRTKKLSYVQEW